MELTQPVPTTVIPISNSRESMSTTTRPPVEDTSQEPSSWILSQEPWTPSELDHSVNSSDQTTSSSDKPVAVPDPVWEPSSSPRSEKSTQIESWPLSPSCPPQRSLIPSLSHTMPPFPSISLSRTPMRLCALITKLFTISASEPSSSPPQPTVILTISSPPLFQVSLAASDSQVNSTLILESLLSTSSHSLDSISS